jgi:hypothetical protein
MTWHPRNQSGAHLRWRGKYTHSCGWRGSWWRGWWLVLWRGGWLCRIAGVADDWLLAWRVNPVQLQTIGWGRRVESVARVVARGQCCRRRVSERAVMQDVGSSPGFHQWIIIFFLYAMVMSKNTFWELLFLSLDQTPSFSRTSSDTSCWDISRTQSHTIYVVRQLAYSTELLVCINEAYKQYKQRRRR